VPAFAAGSEQQPDVTLAPPTAATAKTTSTQSPAAFLDMLRQIAACDLREIDHIGQIVGAKVSVSPKIIEQDGHRILGWVDVSLGDSAAAEFRGSLFQYSIAIQGALYKIAYTPMRDTIATMSFAAPLEVACVDEDILFKYFGSPVVDGILGALRATRQRGLREAAYQVNKGDHYATRLTASFTPGDSCAVNLALTQESTSQ
jgi:hypothetical protein